MEASATGVLFVQTTSLSPKCYKAIWTPARPWSFTNCHGRMGYMGAGTWSRPV